MLWEAPVEDNSGWGGTSAFDLDADGDVDVLHGDLEHLYVFDGSTGTVLLDQPRLHATCTEYPTPVDVDGDGHAEIVSGISVEDDGDPAGFVGLTVLTSAGDPWGESRAIWNQHAYSITNVNDDGTIPTYPDPNWLTYNNFRSGSERVPDGYRGPDLYGVIEDVCEVECEAGDVTLWIRLGNQGYGDVTNAIAVDVWGVTAAGTELLETVAWTPDLPAGELSQSVEVTLSGAALPIWELWIEVDGGDARMDGVQDECDETNNVTRWDGYVCL